MLGETVLLCGHNDVLKFLGVEEGVLSQNTWWICHPDLGSRHLTFTCQECKIYSVKHLVLCIWTPEQFHAPQDPQDLWVSSWIYKILMDENWPEWIIGNVGCLFVGFGHLNTVKKTMNYSWYSHIFQKLLSSIPTDLNGSRKNKEPSQFFLKGNKSTKDPAVQRKLIWNQPR